MAFDNIINSDSANKAIIFLSDGGDDLDRVNDLNQETTRQLIGRIANAGIKIYTIGFNTTGYYKRF